jgi:hypothetical protein
VVTPLSLWSAGIKPIVDSLLAATLSFSCFNALVIRFFADTISRVMLNSGSAFLSRSRLAQKAKRLTMLEHREPNLKKGASWEMVISLRIPRRCLVIMYLSKEGIVIVVVPTYGREAINLTQRTA